MIAVDASALVCGPRSVARVLRGLLQGWRADAGSGGLRLFVPGNAPPRGLPGGAEVRTIRQARTPRGLRRRLPRLLAEREVDGLFAPWSAIPDLRTSGIPTVALVHELPFVGHPRLEGRVREWRHRRWLRRDVRACAAIVTPSRATRADLLRLHPEAVERVHVLPNPFDPAPWRSARCASDRSPYAVMVGVGRGRTLARKKGLDVALAAWSGRHVPAGLRLVLVGEPAWRLPPGVTVVRAPNDEQLCTLVARAAVLIYPSRSEGFGYPPLEALAAGVPVVASALPAVAESAGAGVLAVRPGDAVALGDGLRKVLQDPATRAELLRAGEERVQALSPERFAHALQRLFASLGAPA